MPASVWVLGFVSLLMDVSSEMIHALLVVDDDMLLRGMATRTLRHAGFEVLEADSGERALELFDSASVDLLLLDVMMAGIDGYETCRRLRALPHGQRMPVLMLTGLNDTESIERAYEAGATDFITKPIQWALLTHRVRYGLRAASAAEAMRHSRESLARAQRMAHMGNWSFNSSDRQMACSGISAAREAEGSRRAPGRRCPARIGDGSFAPRVRVVVAPVCRVAAPRMHH